jgi:hypothetical protein
MKKSAILVSTTKSGLNDCLDMQNFLLSKGFKKKNIKILGKKVRKSLVKRLANKGEAGGSCS